MKNQQQNSASDRKRRFLLVLPALILPFITLMFWALGGGSAEAHEENENTKSGFNSSLPDANIKDESSLDKLSYYDKAMQDSAKRRDLLKNDPNYQQSNPIDSGVVNGATNQLTPHLKGLNTSPYNGAAYNDPNEARIYERLNQLNQAINQPSSQNTPDDRLGFSGSNPLPEKDVHKLELLMKQIQSGNTTPDPELDQLNGMLDKIMSIQNPALVQEKLKHASEKNKGQVFSVVAGGKKDMFSVLESKYGEAGQQPGNQNEFYSLDDPEEQFTQNAIDAVVHETQTIVSGSTVKLRLLNDIYVNGKLIPKDNFVFGTAQLSGERLEISIDGIQFRKSLFPVQLSVVDIDGINGIYIPGAISRDVAKQSTDQAIQDLSFGSMSNSIGIQAAGTGLEAAKSLFSKKIKLIKVTVKAGYKVLLRDENQKQD
jgi:conjugative transposon TraM protein